MISKTIIDTDKGQVARVTFTLPDSIWANSIYLVGDFNGWNETLHPLQHTREGSWMITLDLELGRSYQFRYRVDGEWMNDGQADAYVQNPYGSYNFVITTNR